MFLRYLINILKDYKMKAYKHLIKHCLKNNLVVSVYDGGEFQVKLCDKYQQIIDAIESVDESELIIRDKSQVTGTKVNNKGNTVNTYKKIAWVRVILEHNQPDAESVADYTICDFMENWDKEYDKS
jgi:hypothetical protein